MLFLTIKRVFGLHGITVKSIKDVYDDRGGREVELYYTEGRLVRAVSGNAVEVDRLSYRDQRIDEMAGIISPYKPKTILEVGAGELTTVIPMSERIKAEFFGLDLSFQRIAAGVQFFGNEGRDVIGLQASAYELPFPDDTFDVVYTCHAIEVMPRFFRTAISEALRVSKGNIFLFEPSYELGPFGQKVRMHRLDYVRGIPKFVHLDPTMELKAHFLLEYGGKVGNQTACYHIVRSR